MFNEGAYLAKQEAKLRSAGVEKLDSVNINDEVSLNFSVDEVSDIGGVDDSCGGVPVKGTALAVVVDEVDYGNLEDFSEVEAARAAWVSEVDEPLFRSMLENFDAMDEAVLRTQAERNAELLALAAADRELHSTGASNNDSIIDESEIVELD